MFWSVDITKNKTMRDREIERERETETDTDTDKDREDLMIQQANFWLFVYLMINQER